MPDCVIRLPIRLLPSLSSGRLIGWLGWVFFVACQTDASRHSPSAALTPPLLAGTYLMTLVQPVSPADSAVVAYCKSLEYSLYSFSLDGRYSNLTNGVWRESHYTLGKTDVRVGGEVFQQLTFGRQSLSLTLTRRINGRFVRLRGKAYRLNLSTDQWRFHALARAAFTPPARSETRAQIRERVRNTLYFYSLYFRTIYTNHFNRFKPAAISMPVRFYNGGVRVPYRFEATAGWTQTYATTRDAEVAHEFFRRAAKAVKTYPTGANWIHEYFLVLEKMAEAV